MSLFSDLSSKDLNELARNLKEVSYPKDTPVFFEGEHGDTLFLIKKGLAKIYHTSRDGRTKTLSLIKQGNFFGEMSILTDKGRSASAATITACDFLVMGRTEFYNLVEKNPSIPFRIIHTLCERLTQANRQINALALGNSRARIADMILFLADQFGQKDVVQIKLIHQDMADIAGVSRETVTKLLGEFQDDGAIKHDLKEIVVVNREKLRRWLL